VKINTNTNIPSQTKVKKATQGNAQPAEPKDVVVSYYRQDPYVGAPELTSVSSQGLTPGPDNNRIDTAGNVKPKEDGTLVFGPEEAAFVNVQTFTSTDKTLNVIQKYLGRKVNWSFGKEKITINPDKGEMKNAYYSRWEGSTNFFHYKDKNGQLIHTGKSFEIVSHETGHALLDGIQPGYIGWSKEPMGIHEGFSDITAMLAGLHDDRTIDQFLEETGGDFRKNNVISNMGEQFGFSVYGRPYLRTAINKFTYSPPDTLPSHAPEGELGGESHSFGQLLVGTFYDIMEGIYKAGIAEGMTPREALIKARDISGELFVKGTDLAPPNNAKYKDIAMGMLKVDNMKENGKYKNTLAEVFKNRKILTDENINQALAPPTRMLVFLNSTNEEGILGFVDSNREEFGIDKEIPIKLDRIRKNDDGSEIFDITYNKEVELTGSDYGVFSGASIDVEGGVSLTTKCSGELFSTSASRMADKDIEDIKKNMKEYIKEGRIKFVDPSVGKLKEEDLFDSKGRPYMGYTTFDQGKMKIVRSPVMV